MCNLVAQSSAKSNWVTRIFALRARIPIGIFYKEYRTNVKTFSR